MVAQMAGKWACCQGRLEGDAKAAYWVAQKAVLLVAAMVETMAVWMAVWTAVAMVDSWVASQGFWQVDYLVVEQLVKEWACLFLLEQKFVDKRKLTSENN